MENEKTCSKCGNTKPRAEFHRHKRMADGLCARCKTCRSDADKKHYRRTFKARQAYYKCWVQTPEAKAICVINLKKYRARHPLRHKARYTVRNAIRDGRLVPQPCEVCGTEKSEAHHDDYSKPMEVRWLCFEHHRRIGHGQLEHAGSKEE